MSAALLCIPSPWNMNALLTSKLQPTVWVTTISIGAEKAAVKVIRTLEFPVSVSAKLLLDGWVVEVGLDPVQLLVAEIAIRLLVALATDVVGVEAQLLTSETSIKAYPYRVQ